MLMNRWLFSVFHIASCHKKKRLKIKIISQQSLSLVSVALHQDVLNSVQCSDIEKLVLFSCHTLLSCAGFIRKW